MGLLEALLYYLMGLAFFPYCKYMQKRDERNSLKKNGYFVFFDYFAKGNEENITRFIDEYFTGKDDYSIFRNKEEIHGVQFHRGTRIDPGKNFESAIEEFNCLKLASDIADKYNLYVHVKACSYEKSTSFGVGETKDYLDNFRLVKNIDKQNINEQCYSLLKAIEL